MCIRSHAKYLGSNWKFNCSTARSQVKSIQSIETNLWMWLWLWLWVYWINKLPCLLFLCELWIKRVGEPVTHLLGWNVPPEELSTIPEHWLSYPEPPASLHYLLGTLYIAFTVVALIGNGLVLWVFTSYVSEIQWSIKKNNNNNKFINVLCSFFSPFPTILLPVQNHCVHRPMCLSLIWHFAIFWWCRRHQFSFTIHLIMATLLAQWDAKYFHWWAHCQALEQL